MPPDLELRATLAKGLISLTHRGPLPLQRGLMYYRAQGRMGNLKHPRTFNEKVNWRIINDRRELVGITCDKLRTKEAAASQSVEVARVLWTGEHLHQFAGANLVGKWVLKPNNSSGAVAFGEGVAPALSELQLMTASWRKAADPAQQGEWAYTQARRLLFAEEMLGGGDTTPTSYKFFVFDGVPRIIHVSSVPHQPFVDWKGSHRSRWPPPETYMRFYTQEWRPLQVRLDSYPMAPIEPPPVALAEMLDASSRLGRDYDFIRVDFMGDGKRYCFGELTPYPHAGLTRFHPDSFDWEMGSFWTLPSLPR